MNGYNEFGQPVLTPGDIVFVDNCPFHHAEAENILQNYFGQYNIQYKFLPKYSPDLNPVESCFLKMKTVLKSLQYQQLLRDNVPLAVLEAVNEITVSDILISTKIPQEIT